MTKHQASYTYIRFNLLKPQPQLHSPTLNQQKIITLRYKFPKHEKDISVTCKEVQRGREEVTATLQ